MTAFMTGEACRKALAGIPQSQLDIIADFFLSALELDWVQVGPRSFFVAATEASLMPDQVITLHRAGLAKISTKTLRGEQGCVDALLLQFHILS